MCMRTRPDFNFVSVGTQSRSQRDPSAREIITGKNPEPYQSSDHHYRVLGSTVLNTNREQLPKGTINL